MQLAFVNDEQATHYVKDPAFGFLFLWHAEDGASELPVTLGWKEAADLAWAWLATADYGPEPYHQDGDSTKAWRVHNEDGGRVGGYVYAIAAIEPRWALYGK